MSLAAKKLELPVDGRQSATALAVVRGTARLLHAHGFSVVSELPLPSGRRADLVALIPAQAGIQSEEKKELGPRLREDERRG